MMEFLKGALLGVVLLTLGFVGLQNWQTIRGVVQDALQTEKTEAQRFEAMNDEIVSSALYEKRIGLTSELDMAGSSIVAELGKEALRRSLLDPGSAQFRDTIVTFNWKTRDVNFCGFVNGKNKLGGYTGFQAFAIGVTLSPTIEKVRMDAPAFFNSMAESYEDRVAGFGGRPGDIFKERCGLGFAIVLLQST